MPASRLLGLVVYDPNDQKVGKISDIVVSDPGIPVSIVVMTEKSWAGGDQSSILIVPFDAVKWVNTLSSDPSKSVAPEKAVIQLTTFDVKGTAPNVDPK